MANLDLTSLLAKLPTQSMLTRTNLAARFAYQRYALPAAMTQRLPEWIPIWMDDVVASGWTFVRHALAAAGGPAWTGAHGPLLDRHADAVTIRLHVFPEGEDVGAPEPLSGYEAVEGVIRTLQPVVRSLNALHEAFHHSTHMYVPLTEYTYAPLGAYLPAVALPIAVVALDGAGAMAAAVNAKVRAAQQGHAATLAGAAAVAGVVASVASTVAAGMLPGAVPTQWAAPAVLCSLWFAGRAALRGREDAEAVVGATRAAAAVWLSAALAALAFVNWGQALVVGVFAAAKIALLPGSTRTRGVGLPVLLLFSAASTRYAVLQLLRVLPARGELPLAGGALGCCAAGPQEIDLPLAATEGAFWCILALAG
ncbi:unnamed protein product [Pedinophyceae sp. YPF-701]|nr:unnamed protein product [Pedinophyceae sp. YPF-701]